jgi:hypothetical protein
MFLKFAEYGSEGNISSIHFMLFSHTLGKNALCRTTQGKR